MNAWVKMGIMGFLGGTVIAIWRTFKLAAASKATTNAPTPGHIDVTSFAPIQTKQGEVGLAALQAFKDANRLWPNRKKASDGTLPSAEHLKQSPNSDHNTGEAFDITHDPSSGADGEKIAAMALEDPRVKYVIWNKRIFNRVLGDKDWRPYTGSDPHTGHVHVSVIHEARDDARPWWQEAA